MVIILICDMRHTAVSPEWLNVSSRLGRTPLLQSKELEAKGPQGRKVTPAAKAPCVLQQPRVTPTLQETVFRKSR